MRSQFEMRSIARILSAQGCLPSDGCKHWIQWTMLTEGQSICEWQYSRNLYYEGFLRWDKSGGKDWKVELGGWPFGRGWDDDLFTFHRLRNSPNAKTVHFYPTNYSLLGQHAKCLCQRHFPVRFWSQLTDLCGLKAKYDVSIRAFLTPLFSLLLCEICIICSLPELLCIELSTSPAADQTSTMLQMLKFYDQPAHLKTSSSMVLRVSINLSAKYPLCIGPTT